ncbi:unnamed protein product, partial [Symbiodinium microadriaticum]
MARTQEGKSIAISSGFLDELKVHAIMDLSLGSGALLEAALSRGILYHGLCRNRPRMNWPQGIADRASCGLIATEGSSLLSSERPAPAEELHAKKASSKKEEKLYCTTCCALSKEEWQQKRREVYTEKMTKRGYGGSASTTVPAKGVPCGIGFACNSAVQQSSGDFLCRFDADDVMYPE